jgi:signal transduction histidine kinase
MREVLQQSVTLAEGKAHRGDVSLTFDVNRHLPMLDGDFHQLCQVFSNLLINAFEALDGRGHITIRAASEVVEPDPAFSAETPAPTHAVVVDVIDNGPGVPVDLSDRIFVPFFTTKPKGSGLGLPIVRKIVDAHEGRIDLSSSVDTGTRFRVTLPVSAGAGWFK